MTHARQPIDPDLRAEAVRLVAETGLAEATRRTGLARSSISRWAKAAGVDGVGVSIARNREAVLVAAERRRRVLADHDERAVTLLTAIRDLALQKTVQHIKDGAMDTRSLIGAWTRATHDLQLLTGKETERGGQVDVNVRVEQDVALSVLGDPATLAAVRLIGSKLTTNGHGQAELTP